MKKFLTTFAVLTVIATPAFAQSFDPEAGTGNVLPFSHKSTHNEDTKRVPPGRATCIRNGSLRRLGCQFERSLGHRRWKRRLQ